MIICPECKTENPHKAKRCMNCGAVLVNENDLPVEEQLSMKLIEAEKRIHTLEISLDNQVKLYEDAQRRLLELEQENALLRKELDKSKLDLNVYITSHSDSEKESCLTSDDVGSAKNNPVCDDKSVATEYVKHDYVDLGLPSGLLWATCNVGANSPEDYGCFFAWGEPEPKQKGKYKKDNYRFFDNPTTLPSSVDAATVNWGCGWRMPTVDEFVELFHKCEWEWLEQKGVEGFKIIGSDGNSIFLPSVSRIGSYWSASLDKNDNGYAYRLWFKKNLILYDCCVNIAERFYGMAVRPVKSK